MSRSSTSWPHRARAQRVPENWSARPGPRCPACRRSRRPGPDGHGGRPGARSRSAAGRRRGPDAGCGGHDGDDQAQGIDSAVPLAAVDQPDPQPRPTRGTAPASRTDCESMTAVGSGSRPAPARTWPRRSSCSRQHTGGRSSGTPPATRPGLRSVRPAPSPAGAPARSPALAGEPQPVAAASRAD